jgi:hypothetical protein
MSDPSDSAFSVKFFLSYADKRGEEWIRANLSEGRDAKPPARR